MTPSTIIYNGEVNQSTSIPEFTGRGIVLYEVVRLNKKVFLFLEDHLERLAQSASLAGVKLPLSDETMKSHLYRLAELNGLTDGNARLDIVFGEGTADVIMYFVPHHYPSEREYEEGVKTVTLQAVRQNPNAKIIRNDFRQQMEQLIQKHKVWELILFNEAKEITEGSKSNVFAVIRDRILTPPGNTVLKGITRMYVFNTCRELNIPISEGSIPLSMLPEMQGMFITGTSPKILPVNQIDNLPMPVDNAIMRHLMLAYEDQIKSYILGYKAGRHLH
jgi:branched-chain amino acid aminotransferase